MSNEIKTTDLPQTFEFDGNYEESMKFVHGIIAQYLFEKWAYTFKGTGERFDPNDVTGVVLTVGDIDGVVYMGKHRGR